MFQYMLAQALHLHSILSKKLKMPSLLSSPSPSIPTVTLPRISLSLLPAGDPQETARLFTICKETGVFYLDLRSDPLGESLLQDGDAIFSVAEALLNLPFEEKNEYNSKKFKTIFGYKPPGMTPPNGLPDTGEFYNISQDALLSPPSSTPSDSDSPSSSDSWSQPHPPILTPHLSLISRFTLTSHQVAMLLLTRLTPPLSLPPSTLTALHTLDSPSGSHVRLTHCPPPALLSKNIDPTYPSLPAHTDFGSVTILLNRLGGLQLLTPPSSPGEEKYAYVPPLPHHAIINLGDAMTVFTSNLLKSPKHRVVLPPGEEERMLERYSVVYFLRPGDGVGMRSLLEDGKEEGDKEGEVLTSQQWIERKARGYGVITGGEK
jgi:isopenicillin N synthase-like dioxygenase